MTEMLMAQGVAKMTEPTDYSRMSVAEDELSRQLDRVDELRMALEKKLGRVLKPANDSVSPSGPQDMYTPMGYFIRNAADRVRTVGNHLEELYERIDL